MNNLNKYKILTFFSAIFLFLPISTYAQEVPSMDTLGSQNNIQTNYSLTPSGSPGVNSTDSVIPKAIVVDESSVTNLQNTLSERTSGSQALSTGSSGSSL